GNTALVDQTSANGHRRILLSPGSNNSITAPVITSVSTTGNQSTIQGTLSGAAGAQYLIEFFSTASSAAGQGQVSQGFALVTTNGAGSASFAFQTATALPSGMLV